MLKVDIRKRLARFQLNVAFELGREILVLFGPSGAGKSLTLGCVAGLVRPDAGLIQLGERVLFKDNARYVPLHRRRIGVVFQGYALFPHMTVTQNLAYGLRYAKTPTRTVPDMLRRLGLETMAGRYPHQLSGGQQQRVALGRAL
ncbi:MAG: ATP-binding cassette domain-containing protein, partial [Anaerolineae bacterium]